MGLPARIVAELEVTRLAKRRPVLDDPSRFLEMDEVVLIHVIVHGRQGAAAAAVVVAVVDGEFQVDGFFIGAGERNAVTGCRGRRHFQTELVAGRSIRRRGENDVRVDVVAVEKPVRTDHDAVPHHHGVVRSNRCAVRIGRHIEKGEKEFSIGEPGTIHRLVFAVYLHADGVAGQWHHLVLKHKVIVQIKGKAVLVQSVFHIKLMSLTAQILPEIHKPGFPERRPGPDDPVGFLEVDNVVVLDIILARTVGPESIDVVVVVRPVVPVGIVAAAVQAAVQGGGGRIAVRRSA